MGCPDSVYVPCLKCGETSEFQSKSGPNCCYIFELEDCPEDVLMDINRHSPNTCLKCGTKFEVKLHTKMVVQEVEETTATVVIV